MHFYTYGIDIIKIFDITGWLRHIYNELIKGVDLSQVFNQQALFMR